MKKKNERVVAYCRVSTEQESQETSFQSQLEHYQKLFKQDDLLSGNCGALYQNKVLTLTQNGIYADEGISGAKSYQNREAFLRMIEDAKAGLFDKIYCKNIYRFSRDVEVGSKFIKDLRQIDVEVYFEEGGLSTKDAGSDLVINMMLSVGQEESRAKSSAIQWGIRRQQEKGKFHGAITPYGYDRDDEGYLIVNSDEANVVQLIFNMYFDLGYGTQKIARELNRKNIPTKLNKRWSNKQICDIIANEIYKGVQITNKVNIDATARFTKKDVAEENRIVHYFEHLVIIDEEYFDRVQEERDRRSKDWREKTRNHRPSSTYLLSNLIKCGNCGSGFSRKKRKAYTRKDGTSKDLGYEWVCSVNDKYGKDRCKFRNSIIEEDLIDEIIVKIKEFKKDKSSIIAMKNRYLELYYNMQERLKEKKELEQQLEKLEKQVQLNFDLLTEEIISKEEYKNRNDSLQEEIKQTTKQINNVASIDQELIKVEKDYNYYINLIDTTNTNKLTNARLKKLIEKIVVTTDENGEKYHYIDWRFLKTSVDKISTDYTMYMMQQDHGDLIPPEFKDQKFRI